MKLYKTIMGPNSLEATIEYAFDDPGRTIGIAESANHRACLSLYLLARLFATLHRKGVLSLEDISKMINAPIEEVQS